MAPGARVPVTREPTTRSAVPSATGPATAGRSPPSKEPSASANTTTAAVVAMTPARQAAPNPRRGSVMTRAPRARATAAVSSAEPLSTTSRSVPGGKEARADGRASASSRAGRITVRSFMGPRLAATSHTGRSPFLQGRDGPRTRRPGVAPSPDADLRAGHARDLGPGHRDRAARHPVPARLGAGALQRPEPTVLPRGPVLPVPRGPAGLR